MPTPRVITGSLTWPPDGPGPVVTIGNFDGVHLGHRALIATVRDLADSLGCATAAYTFHPSPAEVLRPEAAKPKLQTLDDRVQQLLDAGLDHVVVEPFDAEFASHDARWFATEVLGSRLRASAVMVGWDFRFGRRREGSYDTLKDWLDVPVERIAAHKIEGEVVSSTLVRQAIKSGRVARARDLLGRPHCVRGPVVQGDQRGRLLGFPTANVHSEGILLPPSGVYAVHCAFDDGPVRRGVCNLGVRPTFGQNHSQLEIHVLDFRGDLYGKQATIEFMHRIRSEQRFDGVDALVEQITRDADQARTLLAEP